MGNTPKGQFIRCPDCHGLGTRDGKMRESVDAQEQARKDDPCPSCGGKGFR